MLNNLKNNIRRSWKEDPEKFTQKAANLTIGIGVSALLIVAAVNVMSVITVFSF